MERLEVVFIADGGANPGEICAVEDCFLPATTSWEICNADALEFLASVSLCDAHGKTIGMEV